MCEVNLSVVTLPYYNSMCPVPQCPLCPIPCLSVSSLSVSSMVYEYHKTLRASRATVPNTLRSVCVPCHSVQYPAFRSGTTVEIDVGQYRWICILFQDHPWLYLLVSRQGGKAVTVVPVGRAVIAATVIFRLKFYPQTKRARWTL